MKRHGANLSINKHLLCLVIIFTTTIVTSSTLAETVITYLPYQIEDVSHETFVLSGNLSSSTNGIRIGNNVHDIILDLGDNTITFGSGGGDDNYGLGLFWNVYNIEIQGGFIIHDKGSSSSTASGNNCIFIGNSNDLLFQNVNVVADGIDGKCIRNNGTTYNLEIDGGTYRSNSTTFISRCSTSGAVIWFLAEKELTSSDYHIKVHDINISNGPHTGISILKSEPRCLAFIYNNTISIDGINEMYPVSDGNTCHSSGNAYCLSIYGLLPGSKIYNNVLRSGTQREGSQGILLQDTKGSEENPIEIYGNDILVSSGPTRVHPAGKVSALYWRYVPGELGTGNIWDHIHDNLFRVKVDTDTNTTQIGRLAEAVSIFFYDSSSYNVFEKNYVEVINQSSSGFTEVSAIGFGIKDTIAPGYEEVKHNTFRYNHYKAPRNPVAFGNSRGIPGNNIVLIEDTIDCNHSGSDSTTIVFDNTGAYQDHSTGNRLRDCVFLNNANDSDVVFSFQAYTEMDSCGQDVTCERTLKLWIKGYNNLPIIGADVDVINNYGQTVLNGTTNENGLISGVVTYKYLSQDPIPDDTIVLNDSLAFNNFAINARMLDDNTSVALTVNSETASDTITLSNTVGSGSWSTGYEGECAERPSTPLCYFPEEGLTVSQPPVICIQNANGGNCTHEITYDFQVATDINMTSLASWRYNVTEFPDTTWYTITSTLDGGQTYYWRARAYNGTSYSAWSNVQSFITETFTGATKCGDANSDNIINISDALYIINYIFTGGAAPSPLSNGDTNCDQKVNISDALIIINFIFISGSPPCDSGGDSDTGC
jgi:Dockerin type I domain